MAKIAIDVVLLPSEEMMDRAIKINKELLKGFGNKIILDKEKSLPHISLCMGAINEEDLPKIQEILENTAKNFSTFDLTAENIIPEMIQNGEKISGIIIKDTKQLIKIHETIMKILWNYLSFDIDTSMFYNPSEVEEISLGWVKAFLKYYHDTSLFQPHITVGLGETDKFNFPVKFTSQTLALCQLGNYCTCRNKLISIDLKKQL